MSLCIYLYKYISILTSVSELVSKQRQFRWLSLNEQAGLTLSHYDRLLFLIPYQTHQWDRRRRICMSHTGRSTHIQTDIDKWQVAKRRGSAAAVVSSHSTGSSSSGNGRDHLVFGRSNGDDGGCRWCLRDCCKELCAYTLSARMRTFVNNGQL